MTPLDIVKNKKFSVWNVWENLGARSRRRGFFYIIYALYFHKNATWAICSMFHMYFHIYYLRRSTPPGLNQEKENLSRKKVFCCVDHKVMKVVYSFHSFSEDFLPFLLHLVCFISQVVYHIFLVIWLSLKVSSLSFFLAWKMENFCWEINFQISVKKMTLSRIIAILQLSKKLHKNKKNVSNEKLIILLIAFSSGMSVGGR